MSNPAKTLSPTELAKLEHAFATDPASDAYRPLAEAYLGMGRFMEAMVVCKKGVKAHPGRPDPRMLLARVYAEQGKEKKALEELQGALTVAPTDKAVLRMTGTLQLKAGETDAGKANLLKAYEADPADAETAALMTQWKVEVPKKAAPPPPVDPPTERVALPPSARGGPPTLTPSDGPLPARASNPQLQGMSQGAPRPSGTRRATNGQGVPAPRATGSRPAQRPAYEHDDTEDSLEEGAPRLSRKKSAQARKVLIVSGVMVVVLLGYFVMGQLGAERTKQFNRAMAMAQRDLDDDSYASYQKACTDAETALEKNSSSAAAHGILAYAYAIRWGEHGGGDTAKRQAEEHLAAAKAAGEPDARTLAAEALYKSFDGKGGQALVELEGRVKALEEKGQGSDLLFSVLGVLEMNAGDYEHARDNLEKAQQMASSNPRIYAELGTLYRRRGEDKLAWKNFDYALRYHPNHPEAMLGKALVIMDQERPSFYGQAASLLKKLIEGVPPPSPRQLAAAQLARGLLIARVTATLPNLAPADQKKLADETFVPTDANAARTEIRRWEDSGLALDQKNPELHLIKAQRLLVEARTLPAADEVREAIRMDGSRPQFYVELARILMRREGGAEEAQKALTTAISTVGESPKLMVMLGQVYRMEKRPDDALAQFRKAVSGSKAKNPDARMGMGAIYLEKRDFASAEQELTKAASELFNQNTKLAEVDTLLGRTYQGREDRAKAAQFFEKAITTDSDYAEAYFWYAKFLSTGDAASHQKAKVTAMEYLKLDPNGPFVAEARPLAQ